MKKLLVLTIFFIAVPSFFILCFLKEKKEEITFSVVDNIIDNNHSNITIKVKQVSKNKIININLEDYVKGVVAGEMPIYFEKEALKAQAVAARTYALRRINEDNEYDVVDTTLNQVYLDDETLKNNWKDNYDIYIKKLEEVINETYGEYVDYNGNYADTLFFSTSTGITENSEEVFGSKVSYLRSVDSKWDEEVSPVFSEENIFTRDEFCNLLNISDCNIISVNIIDETTAGSINKIIINDILFTGGEVQYLLGLRSNNFSIFIRNNNVVVTTKGFGHGVGMSQYGAEGMSINGYTYKEILSHYYQGTTIKKLN